MPWPSHPLVEELINVARLHSRPARQVFHDQHSNPICIVPHWIRDCCLPMGILPPSSRSTLRSCTQHAQSQLAAKCSCPLRYDALIDKRQQCHGRAAVRLNGFAIHPARSVYCLQYVPDPTLLENVHPTRTHLAGISDMPGLPKFRLPELI